MTAYLLFTPYDLGNRPTTFVMVDYWCGLFKDLRPAFINRNDCSVPSERSGVPRFASYKDARSSELLSDLQWVWLDEVGDINLDEYVHPVDNVVYVLGQEQEGFGDCLTPGDHVRVRIPALADAIASPSLLVPILCYDRWAYINGGRG
jgi:hypothetical protein